MSIYDRRRRRRGVNYNQQMCDASKLVHSETKIN